MSAFLRQTFDETFGDADGNITTEELDAGENLLRVLVQNEFEKYAHQQSASGLLMIDETGPKAAEVTSLVTDGVLGPVASDESITLHFDVRVGFPTFDSDVHTVRLDMGPYYFRSVNESTAAAVAGDFTVTVVGIDGWTIDGSSIQPGCASENWDEASQSVVYGAQDVNCFTGRSGLIMAFSVTGQESSGSALPGFGMPLLVLGLVGAGVVLRRRL
jgi:hypothetical protein